jgi:hypothetical protein
MSHLAVKESRLMRITLDGDVRFIQARQIENGNWKYHEGRNEILSKSRYGPMIMKKLWEEDYQRKGKEVKIKLY